MAITWQICKARAGSTPDGLQKEAGIAKSQKVLLVDCFDPKWGRKAYAIDGVFAAVISALHRTA